MHASRSCSLFFVVALGAMTVLSPLKAGEEGELYFEGFQAWKKAEAYREQGNIGMAVEELKKAEKTIAEVQKRFPTWQPDVVRYRLANVRKLLAELVPPEYPTVLPAPPPAPVVPQIRIVKPPAEFFQQPMVPFMFNGQVYYKRLLGTGAREAPKGQP